MKFRTKINIVFTNSDIINFDGILILNIVIMHIN